jgi:hypothetical protein
MYVFLKNGHFWMTATVHKKKITIAVVGKHRIKYLTSYKSKPTLITYYNLTANIYFSLLEYSYYSSCCPNIHCLNNLKILHDIFEI